MNTITISIIALSTSLLAIVLNYLQYKDAHTVAKRLQAERIDGITDDIMDACFHAYKFITPPPEMKRVMEQSRLHVIARLKQEI